MLRISKESILLLLKFVANIEQKSHFKVQRVHI